MGTEDENISAWVDSYILLKVLHELGVRLDLEVPLVGKYWYNPKTNKIELHELK